ncbi:hypothetical protein QO239_24135 [Cupriavidus taiwanensis]|nr:hypothetical protein [Cupriavidus taiwanensis]MDK3025690.1 hypothetical protein [Cupriavidus taiwanensis]NSX15446.1 hypothetical protein [Cupriavidus taiwanensis]
MGNSIDGWTAGRGSACSKTCMSAIDAANIGPVATLRNAGQQRKNP